LCAKALKPTTEGADDSKAAPKKEAKKEEKKPV